MTSVVLRGGDVSAPVVFFVRLFRVPKDRSSGKLIRQLAHPSSACPPTLKCAALVLLRWSFGEKRRVGVGSGALEDRDEYGTGGKQAEQGIGSACVQSIEVGP